jgi:excisionase family DNA binding protein
MPASARSEAPETGTQPDGLTVEEVAYLTGRHPYVVRRWIREGVLPAVKLTHEQGQPYRVRAVDLALVVRRRRWGASLPPAGAVPERLARVASIAGVGRERPKREARSRDE